MTNVGKYTINMRTHADLVQGHGVLSAGQEQTRLVQEGLSDRFSVSINRRGQANITHYHTVNFSFFLGLPFAKAHGKAVGYVHFLPETLDDSLNIPAPVRAVFYRYLIVFYKSMDALVTVNPAFIEPLVAYGVAREKIVYIPNFVDDDAFYPLPDAQKQRLRRQYGLDPDRFTVVCAGQLQTRKGIFDFAQLARKMPDLQFVWAGGFSFGKMTEGYAEIVRLLNDPPANLLFPGMIPRERMNEIYNLGDVMFLPSFHELFPMTILEAMSCHIPVLLRDIDVYPRILFDFYLRGNTLSEFESCLLRLRDDPDWYARAVDGARQGHLFYSRTHVLGLWDEFYTALVDAPSPVPTAPSSSRKHRKGLPA